MNANVQEILHNGIRVTGVKVQKGSGTFEIKAPLVISNAGIGNTFKELLPSRVARDSYFFELASTLKKSCTMMSVFLGLNASSEELKLKAQNFWWFKDVNTYMDELKMLEMSAEEALDAELPGFYISFPSAKDPNWKHHPGRESKSTCVVLCMQNWKWFEKFVGTKLKKRGEEYEELKNTLGQKLVDVVCQHFPHIQPHIDYVDFGSPLTNQHYIAAPEGEVYGLDHNVERFQAENVAKLRPKTDVEGLYLTGQDVFVGGFVGALFGGVLSASAILGRNVYQDLVALYKQDKLRRKKQN